jgi:phage-related tail protein
MIEYGKDIAYLFVSFIAFFIGNRTKKLDDLSKYQSMYDTFVAQYEKQYKLLENKVDELQKDTANLNLRNAFIIEEAKTWEKKFIDLEKLYNKLKTEFENYKKNHK